MADPTRLPAPTQRHAVPMRDGVTLDTCVWLPSTASGPCPAILVRTPYSRSVNLASEAPLLRYNAAGYAVVLQSVRGVGGSGGRFGFNAPHDRADGHDSVEWIAHQSWCTGAVGMDGHSYAGMTQLTTACARPPHLRCIVPTVPSLDFFREPPYLGGAFSRMHTLVWARSLQFESLLDECAGAFALNDFLTQPGQLARWTSRPLRLAAEGELDGDLLRHYQDVLAHPTLDAWWRQRMLQPEDFAALGDLPVLVVSGNFDPGTGPMALWRGLEAHGGPGGPRHLVVGPWDHNQSYCGSEAPEGTDALDIVAVRLAFFDRHLRQRGDGPALGGRATVFITGAHTWRHFDAFPPAEVTPRSLLLSSNGRANSSRGDGRLVDTPCPGEPDRFIDDPAWPFVGGMTIARGGAYAHDLRERERCHDTLVYAGRPLEQPLTLLGEPEVELFVTADAPDADFCAWLAEHRPDGSTRLLAMGQQRLRYHGGFDQERPIVPGDVVRLRFTMTYVGHRIAPGHALRLLIAGNHFPLVDPNPHRAGPVADADEVRSAVQVVFHDETRPSRLILPVLER